MTNTTTAVAGGGPAGLAAARELALAGASVTVLEKDNIVGGISRTEERRGFRFDVGGHRFFTKIPEVNCIWEETCGDDFLIRTRLSRIFYRGRLMDYPLSIGSTLSTLGLTDSIMAVCSYGAAQLRSVPEDSFEGWVTSRFGRRLYEHFFKTYSEKVWGMPCTEISADWAAQRIKSLSLTKAVRDALFRGGEKEATSLLRHFRYPKLGPGMLYERYREQVEEAGGSVLLEREVVHVKCEGDRVQHFVVKTPSGESTVEAEQFISSMPLGELVLMMDPAPPADVREAARALRQRSFLTAGLIVRQSDPFPDQWIYVHEPDVMVGRVQNYRNWSPYMVPDEDACAIGAEYFAWTDDPIWSEPDEAVIDLARRELAQLGLVDPESVEDGIVMRVENAYPVYDPGYRGSVGIVREWLSSITNLQTIGRCGQHRYNNMDHSCMTGMLAAWNILGEEHDVWSVNVEEDYLERSGSQDVD